MPDELDDNTGETSTPSEPSTENSDDVEDSATAVSEDDKTPETSDTDAQAEDADVDDSDSGRFDKHPRFRKMNAELKELRDWKEAQQREKDVPAPPSTPEEKAVHDLVHKYGLAPKSQVEEVKRALAAYKDQQDYDKFLAKNPEAASKEAVLKALAYTPSYIRSSYEQIYKDVFGSSASSDAQGRKVINSKRVKTGMKVLGHGVATDSEDSGDDHVYTRAEIRKMDEKTYSKNETQIKKQMRQGLIK